MQYTIDGASVLKSPRLRLALFSSVWFGGFVFGALIFRSAQSAFVSGMFGALSCAVSIVGLLLVIILPFLITALAVYESKPVALYLLCFFKAVLYSVNVLAIYGAYGTAGWLVQILLMFTENCTMAMLWFLWLCVILNRPKIFQRAFLWCFGISVLAGVLDLFIISPFAVSIIM